MLKSLHGLLIKTSTHVDTFQQNPPLTRSWKLVFVGLPFSNILLNLPINVKIPYSLNFPFAKWGLDFIGLANPPSSLDHVFILIVIDYFTKWEEVVSLKNAKNE
jgi:hypothetical protein